MQITEQLIQKFFNGQCTELQKLAVRNYFAEFPEILEEYLTENSWKDFQHHEQIPGGLSSKMFDRILGSTWGRKKVSHHIPRYVAATAAALLIAFGMWWMYKPANLKMQSPVAMKENNAKTRIDWKFHINTTDGIIRIPLADGSSVELQPRSEIRYSNAFATTNRNIYLKGSALFKVGPHKEVPFTVFAGGLSTMALGTVFRVTEKSEADVCVQLLEGRVVVRQDNGAKGGETYLSPGQQLRSLSGIVSVQTIKKKTVIEDNRIAPKAIYHFNDKAIAAILKTLERNHRIRFVYADSLLTDMRFTGVFNENKESLDDFMNTLCVLNDLMMEKKNDTIKILPVKR